MSLTTLGNQVAGLSTQNKNVGSALSRSRQHEDSIGRGLSHSVQLGYFDAKKSKVFKPSIIYEDSRKAADVPLVTLQENCLSSLRRLELNDSQFGAYAKSLGTMSTVRKERALMTASENDEVDQLLDGLLHRLILRISDKSANTKETRMLCFHVIEYLLRRYDIHLNVKLAEILLLVMVPLHEDPIFLRMIQLVDLSIIPTWAFLRPYAAPGATVARKVISKQASIELSLLECLCLLAERVAELPCNAHHLAFIATVISESAVLQVTNFGSLTERTCHVLLPHIVAACRQSRNSSLQSWGHVTASTIVEAASLAESSLNILVASILKGAADCHQTVQTNGLLVAFHSLSKSWKQAGHPLQEMRFFLSDENLMSSNIFHEMLSFENLSSRLANLFCDEGIDRVSSWIACILVSGLKLVVEDATTEERKVRKLILNLIREPKLRDLWADASNNYLESFATVFVEILARHQESTKLSSNDFEKSIFNLLRSIDSPACENGIAAAILRIKGSQRKRVLSRIHIGNDGYENKNDSESQLLLLSPLMELKHGTDLKRLQLIQVMIKEQEKSKSTLHQSRLKIYALLDLLNDDSNNEVAIAAGKALCTFLQNIQVCETTRELGESAIQAAYKWFHQQQSSSFSRIDVLEQVFHVLERISLSLMSKRSKSYLFGRIIECLCAFSASSNSAIAQLSSETLSCISSRTKSGKAEISEIFKVIVSHENTLEVFRRDILVGGQLEYCVRRHCVQTLLSGFVEMLCSHPNRNDEKLYSTEAAKYCSWVSLSLGDALLPNERTLLRDCILRLDRHLFSSPQQLRHFTTELATVGDASFNLHLSETIESLCCSIANHMGSKVSVLSILMDLAIFALQQELDTAVKNILWVARMHITGDGATLETVHNIIAQTLCFLTAASIETRHAAIDLLAAAGEFLKKCSSNRSACLSEICNFVTENKANISIGGTSLLSWCLANVVFQSKRKTHIQEALLQSCISAISNIESSNMQGFDITSKSGYFTTGGCHTAAILLAGVECAGEDFFPLETRWKLAGNPILKSILSHLVEADHIPDHLESLICTTVKMLKGMKVMGSRVKKVHKRTNTVDFKGSLQEIEKDTNSFKNVDRGCFLNPYPKDMEHSILSVLQSDGKSKIVRSMQKSLAILVLGNQSWRSQVFTNITAAVREKIAIGFLSLMVQDIDGFDQDIFLALPLGTNEVARMIESQKLSHIGISYLSEYAVVNSKRLARDSRDNILISVLFATLRASLLLEDGDAAIKIGYSQEAMLSAILELTNNSSTVQLCKGGTEKKAETWISILLQVLNRKVGPQATFHSLRVHRICITLLACLCNSFQGIAVKQLIPAMNATVSVSISLNSTSLLGDCLTMIMPQFFNHATLVGIRPADLLKSFVCQVMEGAEGKQRIKLYQGFVGALSKLAGTRIDESILHAFLPLCLAIELYLSDKKLGSPNFVPTFDVAAMILNESPIATKTTATIAMLAYGKQIMSKLLGEVEVIGKKTLVTSNDLILLSINGATKHSETRDLIVHPKSFMLCNLLLQSVCKSTQTATFQKFLRNLDFSSSRELLPFWQDLILVQTACRNILGNSRERQTMEFWETLLETTNETLGHLHAFIPVHIFLAFAISVVKNGGTEELRSIAVRSIADRAILLDANDAEATLFCDNLSFFREMLCSDIGSVMQQSLLVAIEAIARRLCLGSESQTNSSLVEQLGMVILRSSELIETELSLAALVYERMTPVSRETICISSLCTSTCIRICGPRALKTLSKLMKALTKMLCISNKFLSKGDAQGEMRKEAKLMQVSALHSIIAVVETLPQFLAPYLKDLFSPLALPSKALREQVDDKDIVNKLDAIIVSHIPTRFLVPAAMDAIDANSFNIAAVLWMMSLLTKTASKSSRQELVCHTTGLLGVVTAVLESLVPPESQAKVLHATSELFLGFVLKLSEFQLRSLYQKLREWKGDLHLADLEVSIRRRSAFWSLSTALAKELRAIYLPCLSLVFTDLISELESAVATLCDRSHAPGAVERKRQKLEQNICNKLSQNNVQCFENTLSCLQVSLRSDAHDGGRWIREGGSQKFEKLLNPLSMLLQSACYQTSAVMYQKVVEGENCESGNVVSCIVSLALAAGEEQLWKPLNHSVLQAASNDTRVEVRRAAVKCLASLIRTIGEEYMIFVPECLPVLSELLEDSDPNIVSLAQECIALSEGFLGENLLQSL